MHKRYLSFPWFAVLLIVVGAALLLDRMSLVHFGFWRIAWGTVIAFGMFHVVQGFSSNRSVAIFWGTILFLYGVYFLVRTFGVFGFHSYLFLPASLLIFGIAFVMTYINNLKEWFLIIPGGILSGLGTMLLLGQLGYFDLWDIWLPVRRYWPVLLILSGLALLLSGKLKRPPA